VFEKVYLISLAITLVLTIITRIFVKELFEGRDGKGMLPTFIFLSFIPFIQQILILCEIVLLGAEIIDRKNKKIKKEQEKYELLMNEMNCASNCFNHTYGKNTRYYIEDRIREIRELYKIILKNDLYKGSTYNQIKYLLTFIEECHKNNVLDDAEILEEIKSMTDSVYNLLKGYVDNINDINFKANQQFKDYLKKKTEEFIKNNDALTEDFRKMNDI
jgi:hypothetical protein